MSQATPHRPGRVAVLAAAARVAVLFTAGVAVALGAAVAFMNELSFADAAVFTGWMALLYGALFGLLLLGVALAALALGRRPGARVFAGVLVGFCVFLNGVLRYSPAIQLFSVTPCMSLLGLLDLAVVTTASVAALGAVAAATARARRRALALAVGLAVALQAFHVWHEAPRRYDLAKVVPPLLAAAPPAPPGPEVAPFDGAKLVVLGLDGLGWEVLLPLLERGQLPNFARLLSGAAYGTLDTLTYAISPVIWETISTGQRPLRHGIGHHFHFHFPGMQATVRRLPTFSLANSPMGVRRLLSATERRAPWQRLAVSAEHARAARLWEIASQAGLSVGVFNWLNTTPVSPVTGFVHGHGPYEPDAWPPEIDAFLAEWKPGTPIEPVDGKAVLTSLDQIERQPWDRFLELVARFHPELVMFYTHVADAVNHVNWKLEVVGPGLFYGGLAHPPFPEGGASTVINRYLDELVGETLARLPDDATLVVVSDHGFEFRGYEHDNAPPGVLVVKGPGIAPGPFTGASVYDVAPTLLALLGLPVADDMQGAPIPPVARDRQIARVATYGPRAPIAEGTGTPGGTDAHKLHELEDYLRGLGYVVD